MSEQKQPTLDNEVTLHHVGDERVDRLRIFSAANAQGASGSYAIVNSERDETLELIGFQRGAVCEVGVTGVTNESLLAIVAHRLKGFQSGPMACEENANAHTFISIALDWMHRRTRRRLAAGVEARGKP